MNMNHPLRYFTLSLTLLLPFTADAASPEAELKALCAKIVQQSAGDGNVKGTATERFSMDDAVRMLKAEGYTIQKKSDNKAIIKVNGRTFILYRFDDGDYQMFYGVTGIDVTPADINEWNRDKRLSRAYLDNDNDPILEADLDMAEGATKAQFLHFVKLFIDTSAPAFRAFLLDK